MLNPDIWPQVNEEAQLEFLTPLSFKYVVAVVIDGLRIGLIHERGKALTLSSKPRSLFKNFKTVKLTSQWLCLCTLLKDNNTFYFNNNNTFYFVEPSIPGILVMRLRHLISFSDAQSIH